MAAPSTTGQLSQFMPKYWDTVLGENMYPNLYFYQFGTKRTLPRNFGKTILIPRLKKQNIMATVTEGTIIGTCPISGQFISGTLTQFGGAYKHSDVLVMTALSDVIELSLIDIGRDIARRMDAHIRGALTGTGTFLCDKAAVMKPINIAKAVTLLDAGDNSRPPDNHYPTIIRPEAIFDIMTNLSGVQWLEVTKYTEGNVNRAYIGEVGRLFGARFVTSTNLKRLVSAGVAANASGFKGYMIAPDAYYVTEINDMVARTYVHQLGSAGAADPINQQATVGAKVFFGVVPAAWTSTEYRVVRLNFMTTVQAAGAPPY